MEFYLGFVAVLATASAASYEDILVQDYNLYKLKYQKFYKNPDENLRRFQIYLKNKQEIENHNIKYNKGEVTFEMELNDFADWLPEERRKLECTHGPPVKNSDAELYEIPRGPVPDHVNWVEKGAVTPVRQQGQCGSCYAFAAVGSLESLTYLKTNKLVPLSEQQVVDCSLPFGNYGCSGGFVSLTYDYLQHVGGINSDLDYPYIGIELPCQFEKDKISATCNGYKLVSDNSSEEALKVAVAQIGPVATAMYASPHLHFYKRGILNDDDCKNASPADLNHAVLVAGYGTDPKTKEDYWLIKNSWGDTWGEKGYFRLARNKNDLCFIATAATFPLV